MIGMAKTALAGVEPTPSYAVNLNPYFIEVATIGGGGETSPVVYSDVVNGIGPFTYQWTITGSDISITSNTNANTSFSSGGFNVSYFEIATLTVTDTGAANAETTRNIEVVFEFF